MNSGVFNIGILLFGALQGFLISLLIFPRKKSSSKANIFLFWIIVCFSWQMMMKAISKMWLDHHLDFMYYMAYELPFVYGPLLYFYICSRYKYRSITWLTVIKHLSPFIFMFIVLALFRLWQFEFLTIFFWPLTTARTYLHVSLQLASIAIYGYESLRITKDASFISKYSDGYNKWNTTFIYTVVLTSSIIIIALKILFHYFPLYTEWRWLFVIVVCFVYWISFKIFSNRQQILSGNTKPMLIEIASLNLHEAKLQISNDQSSFNEPALHHNNFIAESKISTEWIKKEDASIIKYRNTGLSNEEAEVIKTKLITFIENEKPHLDCELSLEKLAKLTHVQRHHLSQVINNNLNRNFNDLINYYRVEEARKLLSDPSNKQFTIASVAYDSGFNSISGFNSAFKKITGMSPSAYRQKSNL